MSKEREAFEAWAYSNKWNVARVRDMALDHYVDDFVNGAWHGWQAAKAQAIPEGFVVVPKNATKKMLDAGYEAHDGFFSNGAVQDVYVAMIEAQEPADDN